MGWKWGCQPFSCRCSQNVTHCNRRFVGHVSFQESIPAIPFGYSKHPLPARSRFLRAAERSTCFALWLHHAHPFVAATEKECVSCKERLVTELWPPRSVTMQWLCSQLCYVTAANQWTLFEIELLATVGWKWGCQPFSCRCSQNVTHWQKEICSTSLSKESLPAIHFGYSKHPLPARRRFLRAAVRFTCFALWLHHAHPFVAATEKECVSCREAERLVTELWPPRFVTMQWLCSQLCCEMAANQRTLFEIELFSNSGLEVACQPFSCRCSQNVTHCNRRFVEHVSFQESIPAIPFGYSKHPLPARKRFLRAAVSSTCFALWLHPAHPFVAAAGKTLSDAEKQRVWSRSCVSQDLLQCSDCALSRAIWLLQTNEQLLRLSF